MTGAVLAVDVAAMEAAGAGLRRLVGEVEQLGEVARLELRHVGSACPEARWAAAAESAARSCRSSLETLCTDGEALAAAVRAAAASYAQVEQHLTSVWGVS